MMLDAQQVGGWGAFNGEWGLSDTETCSKSAFSMAKSLEFYSCSTGEPQDLSHKFKL